MQDVNMTKIKDDWKIKKLSISRNVRASAKEPVVDDLMKLMHRDNAFRSRERISKFFRSTKISDQIAHNYMMEQIIEHSITEGD